MNNFNQSPLVQFPVRIAVVALAVIAMFAAIVAHPGKTMADDTIFLSVVDDLPLMAGLSESGDGVQFESPQGRIAEATATGNIKPQDLSDFYENALPQLGWEKIGSGTYMREGEVLKITTALPEGGPGGELVVVFSIHPQKGG